jgi:histidinol-phosphate/aromatic aminotransferase/cobyric acid decarboxylase-like protein
MAPTDRHGGNLAALARRGGRAESGLLDFSANINPIGAPACVRDAVLRGYARRSPGMSACSRSASSRATARNS